MEILKTNQPKKEVNWDKISWGKCKHAFLVEAYKKGLSPEDAEYQAEEWANMSMRVKGQPAVSPADGNYDQPPF